MPARPRQIDFEVDEKTGCFNAINVKKIVRDTDGRSLSIQKFIYEQCLGEVEENMQVVRKCGNTNCINPEHLTLAKHFNANPLDFEVDEKTGCFVVTSHLPHKKGYIQIKVNGATVRAHRFVFEQMFGEIPKGLVVRHKCDNPRCINPEHLELGTQGDNVQDMVKRNRQAFLKGSSNGFAKLTEDDVRYIKGALARGEAVRNLAKQFRVSIHTIYDIKKGKSWSHVS